MVRCHGDHAAHGKRILHVSGQGVHEFQHVFGSQESLTQAVQALNFAAALLRAFSFATGSFGKVAGHQRGDQKGKQCYPVLGIGDGERTDGRQKEKVEGCGSDNCLNHGVAQSPIRGGEQHAHQKHQSDCGVVDVQPETDSRDHADDCQHTGVACGLRPCSCFHVPHCTMDVTFFTVPKHNSCDDQDARGVVAGSFPGKTARHL
jgi:hypothetical protein